LQLELSIGDAMSLKDKRRAIKSLKIASHTLNNVSIAEVGALMSNAAQFLGCHGEQRQKLVEGALSKLVDLSGQSIRGFDGLSD